MEVRLYPVTEFYGGNLYYPIDQAHAVFARYREWIASAPDELNLLDRDHELPAAAVLS